LLPTLTASAGGFESRVEVATGEWARSDRKRQGDPEYAISRDLIQWESQSVTRSDGETGRRFQALMMATSGARLAPESRAVPPCLQVQQAALPPLMASKRKRKGRTVTFSVSVDPRTKKLLRDSELIAQIAEQAARQEAAARLLAMHGRPSPSDAECDAFEQKLAAELAAQPTAP
jgi:hypothetical protein